MPQMSPLLWSITFILTISLLLSISSFLYFMNTPSPKYLIIHSFMEKLSYFNWTW